MKKLLTFSVLGFLLVLALPTPALAHGGGEIFGLIIVGGIWAVAMIAAITMLVITIVKISSFEAALSMFIINALLFFFSSMVCFGKRDYFAEFGGFFHLTFAAVCLVTCIVAMYKNAELAHYKYIALAIFAVYTFFAARSVYNFKYQDICLDAIKEGNKDKVLFCINKLGANKTIKSLDKYRRDVDDSYGPPRPMTVIAAKAKQPEIVKLLISKGADYIDEDIISVLAATGDIEMVKKILDKNQTRQNYSVNYSDMTIYPVTMNRINLRYAVENKQYDMIKFLLSRGADPETAIKTATATGDKEMLQFLLNNGVTGNNAIYQVSLNGDTDTLKQLLAQGADVNAKNQEGKTALMGAAKKGQSEVVKILLDAKADINAQDASGKTALIYAAKNSSLEVVKLLLAAGADVNIKDKKGETALLQTATEEWSQKFVKDDGEIIKLLVNAGADVNVLNEYKETILSRAAGELPETVRFLIDKGADVNVTSNIGRTALMNAVYDNNTESTAMLIAAGADVNAKDNHDETALYRAIYRKNVQNIKLLLDAGADPNNISKYSNWHQLLDGENISDEEVILMFIKAGANVNAKNRSSRTPLIEASYKENINLNFIKTLIQLGANVNAQDKDGRTALMNLYDKGHTEAVEMLIQAGANINIGDKDGETALITACRRGQKDIVQMLIKSGADVNTMDRHGMTALMETHDTEIMKILLAAGADINKTSKYGYTALYNAAAVHGKYDNVKFLLEAGADINIKTKDGKTVLDDIQRKNYPEITKLLESYKNKTPEELKQMNERKVARYKQEIKETMSEENPAPQKPEENKTKTSKVNVVTFEFAPKKAEDKKENTAKAPLAAKEEINTPDQFGETPLLKAVKKGQTEEVKKLIAQGADVNFADKYSESVLMAAVKKNQTEIAKLLINAGADVNYTDKYGRSILKAAQQKGVNEMITLLKSAGAKE